MTKIEFQATNADDLQLKLTATMTLRQWKMIMETISKEAWNTQAQEFKDAIRNLVRLAEIRFTSTNFNPRQPMNE